MGTSELNHILVKLREKHTALQNGETVQNNTNNESKKQSNKKEVAQEVVEEPKNTTDEKKIEEVHESDEFLNLLFEANPTENHINLLFRILKQCKKNNKPVGVARISKRLGDFWPLALNLLKCVGFSTDPD